MLLAIAAFGMYTQTASNTISTPPRMGSGSAVISGYTITALNYVQNAANPQNVDSIAFTIFPAATTAVKAQLVTGGPWYSCANAAGSVTCNTTAPQATMAAPDQLTITAAG